MKLSKYFGPSTLVTAAFIGPGTITVCSLAGLRFGYSLLYALLFATVATIILQEMAARIGLISQNGLGKTIKDGKKNSLKGYIIFLLVLGSILIGNAAYEAGNIGGAVLGIELVFGKFKLWPLILGLFSAALLYFSKFKTVERVLVGLVLLISGAFLVSVFILKPPLVEIMRGFVPNFTVENDWLIVIGLVGTTVVPYNLFLHASIVSKTYKKSSELKDLRIESFIAIALGGLISMLILIVAGSANMENLKDFSALNLADGLTPLLGKWAYLGIGAGLFAAGLSSAITAPLAAALVANELFGWNASEKDWRFRATWGVILGIGVLFSMLGFKPILIIQFAQILNGVLLPIIAIYLLFSVNKKEVVGEFTNSPTRNIFAVIVVAITILISIKTLWSVFFA